MEIKGMGKEMLLLDLTPVPIVRVYWVSAESAPGVMDKTFLPVVVEKENPVRVTLPPDDTKVILAEVKVVVSILD